MATSGVIEILAGQVSNFYFVLIVGLGGNLVLFLDFSAKGEAWRMDEGVG